MQNSASVTMYGTVRPIAGISVAFRRQKQFGSDFNLQPTSHGRQKEGANAFEKLPISALGDEKPKGNIPISGDEQRQS